MITRPIPDLHAQLHEPANEPRAALALTHGAGSNMDSALLTKLADAFASQGVAALRYNLYYRRKRPHGPPFPATSSHDRESVAQVLTWLRTNVHPKVFGGGHSYGGRQSSMLAAEQRELLDGLLCLSYPLHPVRKPEELRTAHFPSIHVPTLFVHGTRDPFGLEGEMQAALAQIPARHRVEYLAGDGHELKHLQPASVVRLFLDFFGL